MTDLVTLTPYKKAENKKDIIIRQQKKQIKELEQENERLKGDLELWESGGCRATNLFECSVVKELKEQLTKAEEIIRTLYFIIQGRIDYENNIQIKDSMDLAQAFLMR
jgi:hypothetical protein